jgi:hypothetical protein
MILMFTFFLLIFINAGDELVQVETEEKDTRTLEQKL